MKTKKNPKYDLETKRKSFFLFGLIISLTAVLFAFKGTSEVTAIVIPTMPSPEPGIEVFIPPTKPDKPLPPPPPKMELFDFINITDDPTALDPEIEFAEIDDPMPNPIQFKEETPEELPLIFAQQMPEFPGGPKSLNHWLSDHIKYPFKAQQLGISGRVYLSFVVDKDGSITNIKITRGVDPLLDDEAIRLISAMPKWNPGLQNGLPVKVCYNLYVSFKMN